MAEIPYRIRKKIDRYEEIEVGGICLYPIKMEDYDAFLQVREAIAFLQQSLPVAYLSVPLLQAYYQMDVDSFFDEKIPTGLFAKTLLFLSLSLKIGTDLPIEKRAGIFRVRSDPKNAERLKCIEFSEDGEIVHQITPMLFQRIRPIIAAQNGIPIPDDDVNPELVETEAIIAAKNSLNLEATTENLVSSVCTVLKADETEVYDWPILKFQRRERAAKRIMDYAIYSIGEMQGVKWKKGNPVPHPWFPRSDTKSNSLMSLKEFAGGAAEGTVMQSADSD